MRGRLLPAHLRFGLHNPIRDDDTQKRLQHANFGAAPEAEGEAMGTAV